MSRNVHIICPEVPWPADHSKAIDSFSQIKSLYESGIKIHLHYFCSDLHCHPTELNLYCESVHKYEKTEEKTLPGSCNDDEDLVDALSQDVYPLIIEGIYCSGILSKLKKPGRRILLRMYDDECKKCEQASKIAEPFIKKIRLARQSRRLKELEKSLPAGVFYIFSLPENAGSFNKNNSGKNTFHLPLFYPFKEVTSRTGLGNFCLYHGDLSDACNEKAANWLLTKVFNDINVPLVIAGRKPGKKIRRMAHLFSHSCYIADPSTGEMDDLIGKAHIHVLPSFNYKRPELKLVHALHAGRHCVVNETAVTGTGLEGACYIASNANAFKSTILQLIHRPFEEEEIELRKIILGPGELNDPVEQLLELLFEDV